MSKFFNAFQLAMQQLRRSWTRTGLTSLGILIGVAAVIAMVGLGRGATQAVEGDLATMGSNQLILTSGTGGGPQAQTAAPPFDAQDVRAIEQQVPYLAAVAPTATTSLTAVSGGEEWQTSVTGSTNGYLHVRSLEVASGRGFTDGEQRSGAAVCVLGETVSENLFNGLDPLGGKVMLGNVSCEVVGVFEPKGQNTMGMDQDDLVFVPLKLVQRRLLGSSDIASILLSADAVNHIDVVKGSVEDLMRQRRGITTDDGVNFEVRDTRELARMLDNISGTLTALLVAIAGVSLVVGGIGIMNIMLVSVTERTREIGIRMSIGALEEDVMLQFLVEAVVLSAFGGVTGVITGVLITALGSVALGVPFVVEPQVVVLALVFSAALGVVFGWVPARRAARLEPIDALRHM